ncbi:hypothetical protein CAEBREN_31068 [Caenorhabditis brenneri]|uniref:RING-type domain-containing protein n=1 Tax=Caenorhabditis brenneri TaxID=135651 RepID=G0PD63_CAEBE|nr:hypothetical protein CAEBREN_31068 [Caenorhabditis brenneri]
MILRRFFCSFSAKIVFFVGEFRTHNMAERRDRWESSSSSSDGEQEEPEVRVEGRRYIGRLLSDSESDIEQSDGEITASSESDSDYRRRESTPESEDEDDHHDRFYEHDEHVRRRRGREHFDNLPIPGEDHWFDGVNLTLEELQRDEIRSLKRKLEDSRREIQQKNEDIEELKRSRRDADYEMGRLQDSVYNKKQSVQYIQLLSFQIEDVFRDIITLRYKYDKAQDSKKWLKEEHSHLSDMVQQYYSSKEDEKRRRRRTEEDLARANHANKALKASIKEMNEDNRGPDGAAPSWKHCEICIVEYNTTPSRIPRVLGTFVEMETINTTSEFSDCGHTLCQSCAGQLAEDDELQCPFDRSFTYLKEGSVSGLPKNYSVLQM